MGRDGRSPRRPWRSRTRARIRGFAPARRRNVDALRGSLWSRTKRRGRGLRRAAARLFGALGSLWPARLWRKNWWRPGFTGRRALLAVFGVVVLALCVFGIVSFANGKPTGPLLPWASRHCDSSGLGCRIVTQFLFTWAALAVSFWAFVMWRYGQVRRAYMGYAKANASELVETAGNIGGPVVGRDDLCDVLQQDLRDKASRRPHVLVGGLGVGKTAVLVRLTELLAERGAVPVPIRLRDAQTDIDFLDLARKRFERVLSYRLRSAAQVDRVWHELLRDDRIVVLADGLEEAFADTDAYDRDYRVRVAISAVGSKFPLVIASRPHEALRALDAARVHVEPLSEEASLDSIGGRQGQAHDARLHWVVQTAEVTETPLYLRVARDLNAESLLKRVDTRGADRLQLRLDLMEQWIGALVDGKLRETASVPLSGIHRRAALAHLQALACVGLRHDTQEIDLNRHWQVIPDVVEAQRQKSEAAAVIEKAGEPRVAEPVAAGPGSEPEHADGATTVAQAEGDLHERTARSQLSGAEQTEEELAKAAAGGDPARALDVRITARLSTWVQDQIDRLNEGGRAAEVQDMQAAASRGIQLRIVDHVPTGVRFPHSIMQAYLGSRVLATAISEEDDYAYLRNGLLDPGRELLMGLVMYVRSPELWLPSADDPAVPDHRLVILSELHNALRNNALAETKLLDVSAAAVEVASAMEAVGTPPAAPGDGERPGMGVQETAGLLLARWTAIKARDDAAAAAKLNAIQRLGDAARVRIATGVDRAEPEGAGVYTCLYWICRKEESYPIRLAAAQQIGAGGDAAWAELEHAFTASEPPGGWDALRRRQPRGPADDEPADPWAPCDYRRYELEGWLLPMLLASIDDDSAGGPRDHAADRLEAWVGLVGARNKMPLSLEAALAHGFKHAANRRPDPSRDETFARVHLRDQAVTMIHRARFWYTRLTLLHALCLWELGWAKLPGEARDFDAKSRNPEELVERWLRKTDDADDDRHSHGGHDPRANRKERKDDHPMVRAAADLVVAALETRRPDRYIWIDETGVVAKIGSQSKRYSPHPRRALWIPPSAGWIGLEKPAQQLVADVQILLNLAERGGSADGRDERLQRINRGVLPSCLTGDRCAHLRPSQTVGMADLPDPGDDCSRACAVELCPYPPRGQQPHRVELSEAFCRRQVALIRGPRWRANWQEAPSRELREFWRAMEDRARK
jgi:hypothetical protein